jgi:hypothetical protein
MAGGAFDKAKPRPRGRMRQDQTGACALGHNQIAACPAQGLIRIAACAMVRP